MFQAEGTVRAEGTKGWMYKLKSRPERCAEGRSGPAWSQDKAGGAWLSTAGVRISEAHRPL